MALPDVVPVLIVGSGWARHAAIALRNRADVSIVAVVGRGSERTRALAAEMCAPFEATVERAVATVPPGVAVVAVDETRTPELAEGLLLRGWNVLCAHPVARSPAVVQRLATIAATRGVKVSTDYTLGQVAALQEARRLTVERGPALRVALEYPGRLLPMALHLAVALAGPVHAVLASRRYPETMVPAVERSPAAFPPAIIAEHESGCVTTLVSFPHAEPYTAFRCHLSLPTMRLDLDLPLGRLVKTSNRRGGCDVATLAHGDRTRDPFGALMGRLAHAFVDACRVDGPPPSPLHEEAEVRRIWAVLSAAVRCGARVDVPTIEPIEAA
jgi:hypothetical protein